MTADADAHVADQLRRFDEACAAKSDALEALAKKEDEVQARVREMRSKADKEGGGSFVELSVGGRTFVTTVANITRFPRSVLATLWLEHGSDASAANGTVMRVDGDPTHFQLVLNYLRDPERLPVDASRSAHVLQCLEREAAFYGLDDLVELCAKAPSPRLDVRDVRATQNLSGANMDEAEPLAHGFIVQRDARRKLARREFAPRLARRRRRVPR